MNIKQLEELSCKSDNVLRQEFEAGEYSLLTLREMLDNGYITQERYNRIVRANEIDII